MEPDGSSNDILEFYAPSLSPSRNSRITHDGAPITILRTGPPSYTYGCFTTVLQAFFKEVTIDSAIPLPNSIDKDNDMEQFLNDCDEEEDDDEDFETYDDDEELDMGTSQNDFVGDNVSRQNVPNEIQSLRDLRQHLVRIVDLYTLPKETTIDWMKFIPTKGESNVVHTLEQSRQAYAAILIYSEIRILQFYIWATECLQHQLLLQQDPSGEAETLTLSPSMLKLTDDDVQLLNRQVEGLVSAYIKLRHE